MTRQMELSEFVSSKTHTTDPQTSKDAAGGVFNDARHHRAAILAELQMSAEPLAAEQLSNRMQLTTLQVMKRLSDLKRYGLVCRTGDTYLNRSGSRAHKWAIVGREYGE